MTEDERVVREAWITVSNGGQRDPFWVRCGDQEFWRESPALAMHAAREFTEERLQQIAEVEEEIVWMELNGGISPPAKRIYAREQATLADLRRGMKERK